MKNKLLFENWRKFLSEEEAAKPEAAAAKDAVPGDVPGKEQVHVFDFDDTLGVTVNANRVMAYKDGKPIHKTEQEAREWMKSKGLTDADLLKPNFEKVPERENAIAINLSSSGLAKIQRQVPKDDQYVTGFKEPPPQGDTVLIDFTPSRGTDPETTKPIKSTIDKLKKANQMGAKTAIVTARTAEGPVKDIHGKELNASNAKDMTDFLSKQGAKPNSGVYGVSGQNKGKKIADTFIKGNPNPPKEIHFYDDLSKNTKEVEDFIQADKEIPSELFIYGPGEFAHNEADPNKPNKKIPAKQAVKESRGQSIKITKSYLKKIIKEELEKIAEAGSEPKLQEDPKAKSVYCSQCGGEFKVKGQKHGFSHCEDHRGLKNYDL